MLWAIGSGTPVQGLRLRVQVVDAHTWRFMVLIKTNCNCTSNCTSNHIRALKGLIDGL